MPETKTLNTKDAEKQTPKVSLNKEEGKVDKVDKKRRNFLGAVKRAAPPLAAVAILAAFSDRKEAKGMPTGGGQEVTVVQPWITVGSLGRTVGVEQTITDLSGFGALITNINYSANGAQIGVGYQNTYNGALQGNIQEVPLGPGNNRFFYQPDIAATHDGNFSILDVRATNTPGQFAANIMGASDRVLSDIAIYGRSKSYDVVSNNPILSGQNQGSQVPWVPLNLGLGAQAQVAYLDQYVLRLDAVSGPNSTVSVYSAPYTIYSNGAINGNQLVYQRTIKPGDLLWAKDVNNPNSVFMTKLNYESTFGIFTSTVSELTAQATAQMIA